MFGIKVVYPRFGSRDEIVGMSSYTLEMAYINRKMAQAIVNREYRQTGRDGEDMEMYVINLSTGERAVGPQLAEHNQPITEQEFNKESPF